MWGHIVGVSLAVILGFIILVRQVRTGKTPSLKSQVKKVTRKLDDMKKYLPDIAHGK